MSQQQPLDPVRLSFELREILSAVTVSGPENIHRMDLVLNGLALLHTALAEERKKQEESRQAERETV